MLSEGRQAFDQWIAAVAQACDRLAGVMFRARRIVLEQDGDGSFTASLPAVKSGVQLSAFAFRLEGGGAVPPLPPEWKTVFRGSHVEVGLESGHVLVRHIDLPAQAAGFLSGMIAAQIDRLTPWDASDAIFGRGQPAAMAENRIEVAVAATSKRAAAPLLELAKSLHVASLTIGTRIEGGDGAAQHVVMHDEVLDSRIPARLEGWLRTLVLGLGVAALAATLAAAYVGGSLQSELEDLQQQLSRRSAALRHDGGGAASGLSLVSRRKLGTPSSVIVLETLSRLFPDSTYVTELHIEGGRIQLIGMTQDAPSLIRLLEQSSQFSQAIFFAPTTRAANETAERFHIEAHINASPGSGT
ncbi:MAG: PilN domain-containing protein [Alphaproteobacteria bacterium]|nr:PilN domain-containing protein [Alphaproteobacteria bacterium]